MPDYALRRRFAFYEMKPGFNTDGFRKYRTCLNSAKLDPSIPDTPEEWLDEFNTFSIYQVLPEIIELWGLNLQADVTSKKTQAN